MERYETLFAQLKNRQEGAFVPFVTLGDPGPEQSLKIIDALIEGGADALELGIPSSRASAPPSISASIIFSDCSGPGSPRVTKGTKAPSWRFFSWANSVS